MGRYLFYNNTVTFAVEDGIETVPLQEFVGSQRVTDTQVHILIVEAEGPSMIERVRAIRLIFPKKAIRTLVSYAAALRIFLFKRRLLSRGEDALVVDDLGGKFLLTALSTGQGMSTRVISLEDPLRVVGELKRTQKNVLERSHPNRRTAAWRIFSNNQEIINALDAEQQRSAVFFEESFPVFDVLGTEKFPVQLMTPEDVVSARRHKDRQDLILAGLLSFVVAGMGAGFLAYSNAQARSSDEKLVVLEREKVRVEGELQKLAALTYRHNLQTLPQMPYMRVMDDFSAGIPPGGRIDEVIFRRSIDQGWSFAGSIAFLGQEIFPFMAHGSLGKAESRYVLIEGKQGLKIDKEFKG